MADSITTAPTKEKAAGQKPDVPAPKPKPLTLAQRMAAIRAECFGIGKDDISMETKSGAKFKIKGHTVEGVLSEMRPLFDKHGVHFVPQLESVTHTGNRCDVLVAFEFMDLESAETKTIRWGGSGTDNSDKAFAKAGTNALKEMLKKVFLVTDRDDASEATEAVEHKTDEGISRAQVDKVAEKAREATEKWAATFKLALGKAKDAKEVERLYRDNKTQLAELPQVTRQFFDELKGRRLSGFAAKSEPERTPTKEEQLAADARLAEEDEHE